MLTVTKDTSSNIFYKSILLWRKLCYNIFDVFKQSKTLYHINRTISETGEVVDNGTHEIYVNTKVDDKSDIAELMQYFIDSVGEHPKFARLCKRVKYFKEAQGGVSIMCKAVEDYAKKMIWKEDMESAANLLKEGVTVEVVAKSFKSLSHSDVVGLNNKIVNSEI